MSTLLRVATAVIFIPLLIVLSRIGGLWFLGLVLAILIAGAWEFYVLMEAKGAKPSKKTGVAAAAVLCALAFATGTEHLGLFLATFVLVITLRELFRTPVASAIYDIATTAFGVLYVGWLMSYLVLLRQIPGEIGTPYVAGSAFLLYAFLMAWACDTAAYFVGRAFGRHKLIPRVSPKKSVEGSLAGFSAAVGMALLGRAWFVQDALGEPWLTVPQALVLGALVGVFTQLGDLVESLLKRDAAVKDASHIVPGHGGTLDVFDGLLFSGPVTYYFLIWVVFR